MKKIFHIKCIVLLCFTLFSLSTQRLKAQSSNIHLKLLRQIDREHFGIGATQGLRKFSKVSEAVDFPSTTTITPKKGYSLWTAEGSVTVIMQYENTDGVAAPKELLLENVHSLTGDINILIVTCACGTDGTCSFEVNNGVIGKCSGKVLIGMVNPNGDLK